MSVFDNGISVVKIPVFKWDFYKKCHPEAGDFISPLPPDGICYVTASSERMHVIWIDFISDPAPV